MAKLRKKGLSVSENGKVQTSWFCALNKFLHPRALAKPIGRFIPALVELASIVLTAVVKNHSCFSRNGCRPFIEVYNGEKRILTTVQEIEKMRWGATLSSLCWELSPQLNFFGIYIFSPFYGWRRGVLSVPLRQIWTVMCRVKENGFFGDFVTNSYDVSWDSS